MGDKSKIEWCDATINPVVGCSHASPGCDNCYAERTAARLGRMKNMPQYKGLTKDGRWTGETCFVESQLQKPRHWTRPRRIFVCSMGDLFHPSVDLKHIFGVWHMMAMCPQHTFLVLTKRAERMKMIVRRIQYDPTVQIVSQYPLPNVHLGVTVESQDQAWRIEHLLQTPAAKRFVSCEPLLGPLDLVDFDDNMPGIDWCIVGGESVPGARPMHPDWVRGIRDQCQAAGVPFMFKQWGEWGIKGDYDDPSVYTEDKRQIIRLGENGLDTRDIANVEGAGREIYMQRVGKKAAGRMLDGREWMEVPDGK